MPCKSSLSTRSCLIPPTERTFRSLRRLRRSASLYSSFVFDNYTWSQDPPEYSNYHGKLIPSRIPLTAIMSGKFNVATHSNFTMLDII